MMTLLELHGKKFKDLNPDIQRKIERFLVLPFMKLLNI